MSTPPPDAGDEQQPDATDPQAESSPPPPEQQQAPQEQGSWQQNAYQQGAYQQGAYQSQPQGQYAYAPSRPTNSMALVSLIAGIAGITVVPLIGSIVALIVGRTARKEIAQKGEEGAGLATAGIVLGWVGVAIGALLVLFFIGIFVFAIAVGTSSTSM